jgi:hypothetical protein
MTASDLNTWATRTFLTFLIGAASPLISSRAWSQSSNYPSRPITVIVPFAAGGRPISMRVSFRRGCRKASAFLWSWIIEAVQPG